MRYSLRFGRVARPVEFESVKFEYEQEYDDEDVPREVAYEDLRNFVYGKLKEEISKSFDKCQEDMADTVVEERGDKLPEAPPRNVEKTQTKIGGKTLEYYYSQAEAFPWQAFKEKRKANPGEAAWIFTNTPEAKDIVDLLRREGAIFMRLGSHRFLCKLSGKENQFINRIPQEEEK